MQQRISLASIVAAWWIIVFAVVLLITSCSDDGPALSAPSPTGDVTSSDKAASVRADVVTSVSISGAFEAASAEDEELIVHDSWTGKLVVLTLEVTEGVTNHIFFRAQTAPAQAIVLSRAAPQKGESVCVLAILTSSGELIAEKVFLESTCQHIP